MDFDNSIPKADFRQHDEALLNLPPLTEKDPFLLFSQWFQEAKDSETSDANAFCLSTVSEDNKPSSRNVLVKYFDKKGFVFFTHYTSRKGQDIEHNSNVAMCFHWKSLLKQIRIEGIVSKISPEESDDYFYSRPRDSQIGAWISDQSKPVESREEMMENREKMTQKFKDQEVIPRPDAWGGYRITPNLFEFWRNGAYRLHDRYIFKKINDHWNNSILYP